MRITLHVDQDRHVRRVTVETAWPTDGTPVGDLVDAVERAIAGTYGIASLAQVCTEVLHEAAMHLRDARQYAWNGDARKVSNWGRAADELDRWAARP